jgi:hypothetical protein
MPGPADHDPGLDAEGTGAPSEGRRPAPAATGAPGRAIIWLSWLGTAIYVVVAAIATASPGSAQLALIAVCVGLCLAGAAAFLVAYAIAVGRSRYDAIGMGGLFFLAGTAPKGVRYHLLGSFGVELATALLSASIGLATYPAGVDNALAFGILVPLYGLGLAGLWGARHGVFAPRADAEGGREPSAAGVAGEVEGSG